MEEEMILTATTLQMFLDCPRKYQQNQIHGWFEKDVSEPLLIGNIFHECMERWGKYGKEDAIKHVKMAVSQRFTDTYQDADFDTDALERIEHMLLGMVDGYPYEGVADKYEHEFSLPLKGHLLAGKVDGLQSIGGRRMVFDYKTTNKIYDKGNPDLLRRDFQASLYFYALSKTLNAQFDGVEFIYVKRSELKPWESKNEQWLTYCRRLQKDYLDEKRRDTYYKRAFTLRDPKDETFWSNLLLVVSELDRCVDIDRWIMNETSCSKYGRCPYLDICNGRVGWETQYENRGPDHHPELKGDENE
jgi:hypothetical protein